MQWLRRTLIILLAAVAVSGATYALIQSNIITLPEGGRGAAFQQGTEEEHGLTGSEQPRGQGRGMGRGHAAEGIGSEGNHHAGEGGSWSGLSEIWRNLALMGIILVGTLIVSRFLPNRTPGGAAATKP